MTHGTALVFPLVLIPARAWGLLIGVVTLATGCPAQIGDRDAGAAEPDSGSAPPDSGIVRDASTATDGGPGQVVTRTVSYIEPTSLVGVACAADGGQLTVLDHTTIYYSANDGGVVVAATVPAAAGTGGRQISQQVSIALPRPANNTVTIWVTATDSAGNESETACSTSGAVTLTLP